MTVFERLLAVGYLDRLQVASIHHARKVLVAQLAACQLGLQQACVLCPVPAGC